MEQETQNASLREAAYAPQTSYQTTRKSFYPPVSKTDEVFASTSRIVQESRQQQGGI